MEPNDEQKRKSPYEQLVYDLWKPVFDRALKDFRGTEEVEAIQPRDDMDAFSRLLRLDDRE